MPTESRILGFNRDEVLAVLKEYCSGSGRDLPEYKVDGLVMEQGHGAGVKVKLNGSGSSIEFSESEIAAAIIMYCIKRGIPMARHAMKSLEVAHDTLFLHLRMPS